MSESAKRRCSDPKWLEHQHNRGTKLPLDEVKRMYEGGHTQAEIAAALGVSQKVVWRFMKNHGIVARTAAKREQRGEKNHFWKGGKRINENGYVELYMPSYPKAKPNGYVYEHIYIAEQMLGRPLKSYGIKDERTEVVHHINGVKTDNRPENLLVLGVNEHHKLHSAMSKDMVDSILLNRIRDLEEDLRIFFRAMGK
jgi:predicted ArsR family transcriptional regulator